MGATIHRGDLGMKMLDRDHDAISDLLLEIHFNTAKGEGPDRQLRPIGDLTRLMRSHFLLEEGMMATTRYPGMGAHTMRHEWMMEQCRRLLFDLRKRRGVLTREPMGLLWDSHFAHVDAEDQTFTLWLGRDESSRASLPARLGG